MFLRPLEKVYDVEDSLTSFSLMHGKDDNGKQVGTFKGCIAVFRPYVLHGPEVTPARAALICTGWGDLEVTAIVRDARLRGSRLCNPVRHIAPLSV